MPSTSSPFDYVAILGGCARGEAGALRSLYEHEAPRLLGIAMRILKRRDAAEDVVHEVFVKLWRDSAGFDPSRGGSARAWLGTIVRNRALQMLRGQGRLAELDEAALAGIEETAPDPEHALQNLQDAEALKECLGHLEPVRRTCILLAYVDGCTQTEIAEKLNVPLNTAKSWIRRSLLSLRECLQ